MFVAREEAQVGVPDDIAPVLRCEIRDRKTCVPEIRSNGLELRGLLCIRISRQIGPEPKPRRPGITQTENGLVNAVASQNQAIPMKQGRRQRNGGDVFHGNVLAAI